MILFAVSFRVIAHVFSCFVVLCIRLKYAADASASECVKNVSAAAKTWDLAPGGKREEEEATAAASPEQRSEKKISNAKDEKCITVPLECMAQKTRKLTF